MINSIIRNFYYEIYFGLELKESGNRDEFSYDSIYFQEKTKYNKNNR